MMRAQISCIKHVFDMRVVFQFNCMNTIEEQVLENVSVMMELIDGEAKLEAVCSIPLKEMPLREIGSTFVSFARPKVREPNSQD